MSAETENFHDLSYKLHERLNKREGDTLSDLHQTWFRKDTIDYWRHMRMYYPISPVVKQFPGNKWLTVGDGHYGLDSLRLKEMEPSIEVLPTDISAECLEFAVEKGIISRFEKVNAEKMPFGDNSFDFAFCKEAYHHFPRPYAAVYEMLRVAKKGIILIEPNDIAIYPAFGNLLLKVNYGLKRLLGRKIQHIDTWSYEDAGNFVYGLSPRELEKVALGLNLPCIAYYYYNDYYNAGVEHEKADKDSKVFRKFKAGLKKMDRTCRMGLLPYNKMNAVIFKIEPPSELLDQLKKIGFRIVQLPRNPYADKHTV